MFALHGAQKLFGAFGGMGGHGARAAMFSVFWFGAIIELLGGSLIALGLFTRPVAFLLCGEMAFAYFRFHFPRSFWPIVNGGEAAVLYCFLFLYLFAKGPGAASLDRNRGKSN
jgi:putative oxidoreductase